MAMEEEMPGSNIDDEEEETIWVQVDIRRPLKQRKKIMISSLKFTYVNFKYERLTLFCFLGGRLGHNDNSQLGLVMG